MSKRRQFIVEAAGEGWQWDGSLLWLESVVDVRKTVKKIGGWEVCEIGSVIEKRRK